MEKLEFKKFEKVQLLNNQLRSLTGGGSTTWKGPGGTSGTDVTSGKSHTDYSDGTVSNKDGVVM